MTKKAEILHLLSKGHSTREVAEIVGCRSEYVRVASRQRGAAGTSQHDKNYYQRNRTERDAYVKAWKARNRETVNAYNAKYRAARKASHEGRT